MYQGKHCENSRTRFESDPSKTSPRAVMKYSAAATSMQRMYRKVHMKEELATTCGRRPSAVANGNTKADEARFTRYTWRTGGTHFGGGAGLETPATASPAGSGAGYAAGPQESPAARAYRQGHGQPEAEAVSLLGTGGAGNERTGSRSLQRKQWSYITPAQKSSEPLKNLADFRVQNHTYRQPTALLYITSKKENHNRKGHKTHTHTQSDARHLL